MEEIESIVSGFMTERKSRLGDIEVGDKAKRNPWEDALFNNGDNRSSNAALEDAESLSAKGNRRRRGGRRSSDGLKAVDEGLEEGGGGERGGGRRRKRPGKNARRKSTEDSEFEWSYLEKVTEEEENDPKLLEWGDVGFRESPNWKVARDFPVSSSSLVRRLNQSVISPFGLELLNGPRDTRHPLFSQGRLGKMSMFASATGRAFSSQKVAMTKESDGGNKVKEKEEERDEDEDFWDSETAIGGRAEEEPGESDFISGYLQGMDTRVAK